jgi:diacylglycerol kinase (ATP)
MQISPAAEPDDGLLEVQIFTGPKTDSFTMIPKIYQGRHLPHRNIVQMRSGACEVKPESPLLVEADGEVIGTTPATIEMVRRLLTLKV